MSRLATPQDVLDGKAQWSCILGDCLRVMPGLPDGSIDSLICDPPFDQRTSENARSSLAIAARYIAFDGISTEWIEPAIPLVKRWTVSFCALEQLGAYRDRAGDLWVRAGVWVRTNSAPQFTGDRPGQGAEGIAIMHAFGRKHWNGGGHAAAWVGETINGIRNQDRGSLEHPTAKPLWLMLELVSLFTDPGEVVLDPFAGSATTGVACLRLGRRFIGIEKDAGFHATAVDRLEAESRGQSLREYRAGQMTLFESAQRAGGG